MFTCPKSRLNRPFHVGIHNFAREFHLALEGPFTSAEVPEVESRWRTAASIISGKDFRVDLDEVTFADESARALLTSMYAQGARFVANGAQARGIAGEIAGRDLKPAPAEPRGIARLYRNIAGLLECLALRLKT